MNGTATIINYNANADSIVSAAGRISTTKGCADEIYENSCNNDREKNLKLINKILSSGHESVLEHVSVNLSFNNVSVFVEQFMIEFRLASFTVKSRRYVDFGGMGYILPDFSAFEGEKAEKLRQNYESHMELLFGEYDFFVEQGIPKEDARFVLPYAFKSNFFCTVNARELIKIMNEMVGGRGSKYPEIRALGESLFCQCREKLPFISIRKQMENVHENIFRLLSASRGTETDKVPGTVSGSGDESLVRLLGGTASPEQAVCRAAAAGCGLSWQDDFSGDEEWQRTLISWLLKGDRRRELEQVSVTVRFERISLAGVTHLVRHRMQSIIIPEYLRVCDFDKYVLPESIVNAGLEKRYRDIFAKSRQMSGELAHLGFPMCDQVYLFLSGMTIPVQTTMNANELATFLRLRTCSRAQWEIKACADELLTRLRETYPVMFSLYGPTCYMMGRCPEGKMTCGRMREVCREYEPQR